MGTLVFTAIGVAVGGLYGFISGCALGARKGPAFCRGVVRGFFAPWDCLADRWLK